MELECVCLFLHSRVCSCSVSVEYIFRIKTQVIFACWYTGNGRRKPFESKARKKNIFSTFMAHSNKQRNGRILKKKQTHHIFLSSYEWSKNCPDWRYPYVLVWFESIWKNVHENLNKISGHIIVLLHHDKYFKSPWICFPSCKASTHGWHTDLNETVDSLTKKLFDYFISVPNQWWNHNFIKPLEIR